jgi:hypothetical protein
LIYDKYNSPVLFTELGIIVVLHIQATLGNELFYLIDFLLRCPKTQQAKSYKAFFNIIWKEEWFHGVYLWGWQTKRGNTFFENIIITHHKENRRKTLLQ